MLGALLLCGACSKDVGKISLSNDKDLKSWNFYLDPASKKSADDVFTIKDGVIKIAGQPFGFMYTKSKFSNFKLTLNWKYPKEASNSGIFLFVQEPKLWPNAIECQLMASNAGDFVLLGGSNVAEFKLKEGQQRPQFPVIKKREKSSENPAGQWNSAEIICKDGRVKVFINGVFQNEVSNSEHKIGSIALQSEGGEIWFKDVQIQSLE